MLWSTLNRLIPSTSYHFHVNSALPRETQLNLALDTLKFDLLDVRCTREINAYTGSSFSSKSSGMFVFYNYARISTILDKFRHHVLEFDCTDVPAPDQIDVSLFKVDMEWTLLFQYIVEYPSVLRRCLMTDDADDNRLMSVQTHKLCQFLCGLSACFSKYYSKTKILLVNEKHQWPVMHARISLITIIRNIYLHAFNLLDITPFNRL
ncbi:hypothetical protein HELRODRAFT_180921 [Helobdella robusta]|uniref:DALR anticodon binding domain-containing protein n=1 Tax=Helobdella robusta TaxID=6412 RepID=T1FGF1_HELRO|nr:hypothetical protein HELRODRAFT_180921 [Helobdella robusta]ESN93392.1 hypothetical protein HELRODRAFT_180921 [Helobdella robusta]